MSKAFGVFLSFFFFWGFLVVSASCLLVILVMAFWLSVIMLMVLSGLITLIAVRMAVSSALVEDGMRCVPLLNSAIVSLSGLVMTQPIPIRLLDCFWMKDPSVYMFKLSKVEMFMDIVLRVCLVLWEVFRSLSMMVLVRDRLSKCMTGTCLFW